MICYDTLDIVPLAALLDLEEIMISESLACLNSAVFINPIITTLSYSQDAMRFTYTSAICLHEALCGAVCTY